MQYGMWFVLLYIAQTTNSNSIQRASSRQKINELVSRPETLQGGREAKLSKARSQWGSGVLSTQRYNFSIHILGIFWFKRVRGDWIQSMGRSSWQRFVRSTNATI